MTAASSPSDVPLRPAPSVPAALLLGWLFISMAWWALAFFPTDADSPTWLARAQAICFGRADDGLPETFGWILLIASPIALLSALLVTYAHELKSAWQRLRTRPAFWACVLVTVPLMGLEASYIGGRVSQGMEIRNSAFTFDDQTPLSPSYPRTDKPAKGFSLVDQHGETVSLGTLQGKKFILTFAFAHCTTMCPTIVHNTLQAVQGLQEQEQDLETVIVTLDPWRDTPSSLPTLASQWELPEGAHVLSGSVDEVTDVLERYEMPFERNDKTGDVLHPALLHVVDQKGIIAYTLNNPTVASVREAVIRTR